MLNILEVFIMKKLSLFLLFSLAGTGLLAETRKRVPIPVEASSDSVCEGDSWDIDEVEALSYSSFRELILEAFRNRQIYKVVKVISNGYAHYYDFEQWRQYKDSGSAYPVSAGGCLADPQSKQLIISEETLFIGHSDGQVWQNEASAQRELALMTACSEARILFDQLKNIPDADVAALRNHFELSQEAFEVGGRSDVAVIRQGAQDAARHSDYMAFDQAQEAQRMEDAAARLELQRQQEEQRRSPRSVVRAPVNNVQQVSEDRRRQIQLEIDRLEREKNVLAAQDGKYKFSRARSAFVAGHPIHTWRNRTQYVNETLPRLRAELSRI